MPVNLISVYNCECKIEEHRFWDSIDVWNERPNLLNKRVRVAEILAIKNLKDEDFLDNVVVYLQSLKEPSKFTKENIGETLEPVNNFFDDDDQLKLFFKKLIPKVSDLDSVIELALYDKRNVSATFINICGNGTTLLSPDYIYQLKYEKTGISVLVEESVIKSLRNIDWLKQTVTPKIVRWAQIPVQDKVVTGSLNLVPVSEYCTLYDQLKEKYGKKFVEIWPEVTDPLKFVYEDVAIASYLIILWKGKKQKFVDLGCGNGLLVHILVSEGHDGFGVDVAERKIWKLYPNNTKLKIQTITPSEENAFPDADWVIGNHSDELTPWLPVIAARSSYSCKFFLLPCCSYELNGCKYQRSNSVKSQYMDYLDYIVEWCGACGFSTLVDKLRIPSTKRVCIISDHRTYPKCEHFQQLLKIHKLIIEKCSVKNHVDYSEFKTRSNIVKPRNCTQLDRNFINDLVYLIAGKILGSNSQGCGKNWNEGKCISLSDLAKSIPKEYLVKLKKECGGLQTLIKNNRYVFKVEKGCVSFRKPVKCSDTNQKWFKTKPCWFFNNHPDSCPLDDDSCSFVH